MSLKSRNLAVSLLLALLLCNAAFVAHAASHVSGEVVNCEVCLAHTPLSHGLAQDNSTPLIPHAGTERVGQTFQSVTATPSRSTCARGPPLLYQ